MIHDLPKHAVNLRDIAGRKDYVFDLAPQAPARTLIAAALDIVAVRKARFAGRLIPQGRTDWRLEATLGATVVQDCVISLAPVTTRIDENVVRRYAADLPEFGAGEIEMPEDDTVDPLPAILDLYEVMTEALSLALPPFPRAPGAALGEVVVTKAGSEPMTREKARPFAGLSDLRKSLENKGEPEDKA